MKASAEDIAQIDGFGGVMSENTEKAFREPHFIHLINRLRDSGVKWSTRAALPTSALRARPLY